VRLKTDHTLAYHRTHTEKLQMAERKKPLRNGSEVIRKDSRDDVYFRRFSGDHGVTLPCLKFLAERHILQQNFCSQHVILLLIWTGNPEVAGCRSLQM